MLSRFNCVRLFVILINRSIVICEYKKLEITHQHLEKFCQYCLQASLAFISMSVSHNETFISSHLLQLICNTWCISALGGRLYKEDAC